MHWLQSLDSSLFRFLNQSLSNPLFDTVMPWLSGNRFFVPFVLAAAVFAIWRFRLRGLFFVVTLLLVVWLGDSYVCNTIKQAVARARPYVHIPETHLLVGRGNAFGSLPSSHAANWFAASMIAWIYFRRGAWIFLVLGVAVSFSRVYNGVHYPSDVLAGAILGAGYAAAAVIALNAVWRWVGQRWFPLWWQAMPSLVHVKSNEQRKDSPENTAAREQAIEKHWLRAGYVVIALLLLGRLGYLASGTIELSGDEAYQWQWSKRPALSYYSKPPMIAYTQWAGTHLWGDNEFGVRFFSPVIAATLGLLLLRFFARELSARAGFFLVLIVTATPILEVGATLMTVDPLSVLFWTAAMLAGWAAIKPDAKTSAWLWVGLWMGLGFLSKYTALFQWLSWAVFFALWPAARRHLRRPGPYLALLVCLICAVPVIVWNSQNGWITATHVAGNAKLDEPWQPKELINHLGEFLAVETALLNPIFFVATIIAAVAFWRRYRNDVRLIYFFSMGAPLFLVYLGWTFHSRVLPNWIAPAVLPLFCLMVTYWYLRMREGKKFPKAWFVGGLVLGLVFSICAHETALLGKIIGRPLPAEWDALRRVRGWKEVAATVNAARSRMQTDGREVFIIANDYSLTSLIAFYLPEARARVPENPLVYCRSTDRPRTQFFFWPGYQARKGQNALYVKINRTARPPHARLVAEFESVKDLGLHPVRYRGRVFHTLQIYECRNLR